MDVRFSPEQQSLRDSASQIVERMGLRAVRDLDDQERRAKLEAAVEASGWRELRVASDGDSPLASAVEAAIVAEEMGRGLADAPYLGPTLAADLRRLTGASPATSPETVALVPDLSALAPAGSRAVAIDAAEATSALVLDGESLAQVAVAGVPSVVDLTRPGEVIATSPAAQIPGAVAKAEAMEKWTALVLALSCADLVGTMRGAVALACDYAGSRRQYGAAIGSFQALQHMLADAHVLMEGSRSAALHAAWAVDALTPADAVAAGSVAKAYCARAARTVCETAIQVHGGIGNTWDCLAHVYLRRAVLATDVLGGIGPSLQRVLAHNGVRG